MTFGKALEWLQAGHKIARRGWGGYWFIQELCSLTVEDTPETLAARKSQGIQGVSTRLNFIMPKTIVAKLKDGTYAPATPYQGDILADDWVVIEE